MDELKKLLEEQGKAFADFRKANDERIAQIEKKGTADPLLTEKVDKANAEISRLEKALREVETKANRLPAGVPADEKTQAAIEHKAAFDRFLRKGEDRGLNELQVKALSMGSDPDGGWLTPQELDRSIGKMEIDATPMEGIVSSINAGGEEYEKIFDLRGLASGWVGETEARPETGTQTTALFKPSYGELYANPAATQKMLDDAFLDVEAWLAQSVAEKFSVDLDAAIVSGNGVAKPKGILSYTLAATADATRAYGTIQKVASGASGSFTGDNLIDVIHSLKPGYRNGARWVMPTLTVATCRKFKDATSGQYLWQPGLGGGQPSALLGFPITEDENVPAVAASANAVLFGNFARAYKLVNVRGIRVLRDPYSNKPKVHFYTTRRVGGGVEDTSAVKVLNLA